MKKIVHVIIFFLIYYSVMAQNGKLLLIGGGSENITSTTSWNYDAFNWAIEQSSNKKVAILHYSTTTTSSFENYFRNYCGASSVKSFVVSSSDANNSTLINEISQYDVFYLRGGDQWYYYNYWEGTLMEVAIHNKFNEGGVICGTSAGLAMLSGVMYTAEGASSYSDYCIKNIDHLSITLENNFIEILPGFIFDSHFTERGRMGRLVSFMANWKKHKGEDIVGIGIDEITALAIDSDGNATAYGSGTVNIYKLKEGNDFKEGAILNVDSLEYIKLIQGKTININDFTVRGFSNTLEPEFIKETTASKIYASGNDYLGISNIGLLEEFLNDGNISDRIILFSKEEEGFATDFKNKLIEFGATNIQIYETNIATSDNESIASDIKASSKFLFVNNTKYDLINIFLNSGGRAGQALKDAFNERKLTLAFIGDNARFCGPVIIGNYLSSEANSTTTEGLNLLKSLIIIPRTFDQGNDYTELWHGTHSSLPYAMVKEEVKNGIWLNALNYLVFQGEGSEAIITIHGTSPAMILSIENTKGDIVSQTYNGTGIPQKKAGFDHMYLSFIKDNEQYVLGEFESSITGLTKLIDEMSIQIFPNPVKNKLFINCEKDIQLVCIYDIIGTTKFRANYLNNEAVIDIEKLSLQQGLYMVEVRNWDDQVKVQKIIIK